MKLLCLPSAAGNPYQGLLYSECVKHLEIVYAGPDGLKHLDTDDFAVVHLHWDDRIFGRQHDAARESAILRDAIARLEAFQAAGGQIIWTVHNRDPHKIINYDAFRRGRQKIADLSDVIHVHAPHAKDFLISNYQVSPDKIHVVPHPSYLGAYEDPVVTLGRSLPTLERRDFLFFGMFRGDKGIHQIRNVAGKLTKRQIPYHLRMYGKAFQSQARLLRLLGANPNVDLRTDRIPDADIPDIFGQGQVFLAPYNSLFTSGSVMLALTFGLPVIGPDIRELRETTPEACHDLLYDAASPRGLIRSMLRMVEMNDTDLSNRREACLAYAKDMSPERIGDRFQALLPRLATTARQNHHE